MRKVERFRHLTYLVVLMTAGALLGAGAPAQARIPAERWQSYVLAPSVPLRKPVRVVGIEGSVVNPDALVTGKGATTMTYVEGGAPPVIVLDFGAEISGFPLFDIASFSGAPVLRASYSETLAGLSADGDYAGKTRLTRVQEHPVTATGQLRSRQVEGGQRYVRLALSAPGTVALTKTGIDFTAFRGTPKALRGYFLSSDRLLNRIWYAGVYTVNLNQIMPGLRQLPEQLAKKRVLVDGAKRDRKIWSGDLLISGLTVYYTLDPRFVKGSLHVIGTHPVADDGTVIARDYGDISQAGPLPGVCSPNQVGGSGCRFWSATYSMAFVTALYDYYRYTGDLAFVKRMWKAVERQMAWNARLVGENGLLAVDERTGDNWNLELLVGELSYVNSSYYMALRSAAAMADALDAGSRDGKVFRRRARRIKAAVNDQLWDGSRGLYDFSTANREPVVQDGNIFAVLSGIADTGQADQVLTTVKSVLNSPYGTLNVSQPFPDGFRPVVSPYMAGFQLKTYFEHGRTDDALGLMRVLWGWMIDHDPANTTWERILPDGRLTHRASAAHAWSTGATSALSQYVLGAAPVGPGWSTWDVMPHPGDVDWVRGAVPTPRGPLRVQWQRRERPLSFKLVVEAPEGTTGTVRVPLYDADRTVTRDGKVIWAQDEDVRHDGIDVRLEDGYLVVPAQSGSHRFQWKKRQPRTKRRS